VQLSQLFCLLARGSDVEYDPCGKHRMQHALQSGDRVLVSPKGLDIRRYLRRYDVKEVKLLAVSRGFKETDMNDTDWQRGHYDYVGACDS
jgi:hypothetical protein